MRKIIRWEDCPREDLKIIPLMIKEGWTPEFSPADRNNNRTSLEFIPHDGVSFNKGSLHASCIYNMRENNIDINWRVWNLVDGHWVKDSDFETIDLLIKSYEYHT